MADIATLSIKVDTSDISRATKALRGMLDDVKAIGTIKVSATSSKNIAAIAAAMGELGRINVVAVRTVASSLTGIGRALQAFPARVPSGAGISKMAEALELLSIVNSAKLGRVAGAMTRVSAAMTALSGVGAIRPKSIASAAAALKEMSKLKGEKLKAASTAMRALGRASQTLSGVSSRGIKPLAKALRELGKVNAARVALVAKSLRSLGRSMAAMGSITSKGLRPLANGLLLLMKVDPARLNALATAMLRLGAASARVTAGSQAVAQLARKTLELDRRLQRMAQTSKKAQRALRDTGSVAGVAAGKLRGASHLLRNLATTLVGTFGIGRLVRGAFNAIAEFEQGMVDIQKTARLSEAATAELGEAFKSLGTSSIATTKELQQVGIVAGQLGISDPANILKFSDAITRLSDGAPTLRGNLDQTALSLTQLIQVTGGSVDDIDALASALLFLGNTSKATEEQILKTGIEVASATAAFNVSAQEALGLATALAQVRVPPERGRTAIITTMKNMADALDEGGQRARNFAAITGQSLEEFRTQFRESGGSAFASLVEGLARVQRAGGNVTATLGTLGLNSIRTQTSILALLEGADQLAIKIAGSTKEFNENKDALQENSELMRVSERAADTLAKSYERTRSLFRLFATGLTGETSTLGKVFRGTVELFDDFLRSVLGLEAGFGKFRHRIVEAIEAVSELFGLNPDRFTQFFKDEGKYRKVLEALKTGVVVVGAAFAALAAKAAVATLAVLGPFSLIPLAVGAAVGALYHFRDTTVTVFGETATVGEHFVNGIQDIAVFFVALGSTIYQQGRFMAEVFAGFGTAAVAAFKEILDASKLLFGAFTDSFEGLDVDWSTVMRNMLDLAGFTFGSITSLVTGIVRPLTTATGLLATLGRMKDAVASGDIFAIGSLTSDLYALLPEINRVASTSYKGLVLNAGKAGLHAAETMTKAFDEGVERGDILGSVGDAIIDAAGLREAVDRALAKVGGNPFSVEFFKESMEGSRAVVEEAVSGALAGAGKLADAFRKTAEASRRAFSAEEAAKFEAKLSKFAEAVRSIGDDIENIQFQIDTAYLSDVEKKFADIDKKREDYLRDLERQGDISLIDGGAIETLAQARSELEKLVVLQERAIDRAQTFADTITEGLVDVITEAKSLEDAFRDVWMALSRESLNIALEPLRDGLRKALAPAFGAPGEDEFAAVASQVGAGLEMASMQVTSMAVNAANVTITSGAPYGPQPLPTSPEMLGPGQFGPPELGAPYGPQPLPTSPVPLGPGQFGPPELGATGMDFDTIGPQLEGMAEAAGEAASKVGELSMGVNAAQKSVQGVNTAMNLSAAATTKDTLSSQVSEASDKNEAVASKQASIAAFAAARALQAVAASTTLSAKGNGFMNGKVTAFANGGAFGGGLRGRFGDMLTNGPIAFPMGIAGEAGPEAIVPLTRRGGKYMMGVSGGGGVPLTRDGSGRLVADLAGASSSTRTFSAGAALASGGVRYTHGTSSSGYTGSNVTQNITIQANDVESFRRSERQIQGSLRRGVSSANRNITR